MDIIFLQECFEMHMQKMGQNYTPKKTATFCRYVQDFILNIHIDPSSKALNSLVFIAAVVQVDIEAYLKERRRSGNNKERFFALNAYFQFLVHSDVLMSNPMANIDPDHWI